MAGGQPGAPDVVLSGKFALNFQPSFPRRRKRFSTAKPVNPVSLLFDGFKSLDDQRCALLKPAFRLRGDDEQKRKQSAQVK